MSETRDMLMKAKEEVEKRGYNWEKLLALSKAMTIALKCGLFNTPQFKTRRTKTRAVEAFVAGKKIGEWSSIASAAQDMKVHATSITECASGNLYSSGKYNGSPIVWRYKQ